MWIGLELKRDHPVESGSSLVQTQPVQHVIACWLWHRLIDHLGLILIEFSPWFDLITSNSVSKWWIPFLQQSSCSRLFPRFQDFIEDGFVVSRWRCCCWFDPWLAKSALIEIYRIKPFNWWNPNECGNEMLPFISSTKFIWIIVSNSCRFNAESICGWYRRLDNKHPKWAMIEFDRIRPFDWSNRIEWGKKMLQWISSTKFILMFVWNVMISHSTPDLVSRRQNHTKIQFKMIIEIQFI